MFLFKRFLMDNLQSRINNLRNRERERRAAKPIAGSNIDFKIIESDQYSAVAGGDNDSIVRVKFVPDVVNFERKTMATIEVKSDWPQIAGYLEPQTGDGSLVFRAFIFGPMGTTINISFSLVASGISGGTFSRI